MKGPIVKHFLKDESGAISPLYAVAILVLVAMAGIGFDYGRLMALDSELQNAADQAALAAATQLDGRDDAMIRARDAANTTFASAASAYVNEARFANDGSGRPITSLTFRFFDGYADDAMGTEITDDTDGADAEVVEVTVNAREVFYALTPLIGAFSSGDVIGRALAAIESGTCNVTPVFFCVPEDAGGNALRNFPTVDDVGKGMLLHFKQNQTGTDGDTATDWSPGNFGFLDVPWGTASQQNRKLGLNTAAAGCFSDEIESRTGFRTPEGNALNTRLDLFNSPLNPNSCDASGNFCPAENVRKDVVRRELRRNVLGSDLASQACNPNQTNNVDWVPASSVPGIQDPGYPKDTCYGSTCTIVGNAEWNADTWLNAVDGVTSSDIPDLNGNGQISRYEVYLWELDNPSKLAPTKVGDDFPESPVSTDRYTVNLYCSYPQPIEAPPGWPSSTTQKDRRLLTTAAVDCSDLNGHEPVDILGWVDLFLVRSVEVTGSDRAFFTEITGPATRPDGRSGFQHFSRKKAVLIR